MADAAPAKLRKSWARLRCLVIANSLLRLRTMGRGEGSIGSHVPPRKMRVAIRLIDLRHPLRPKAASRPEKKQRGKAGFAFPVKAIRYFKVAFANFPLPVFRILCLCPRYPALTERGASRSSRTLARDAMAVWARVRRTQPMRTAKPCGPDLPTLRSSSWTDLRTTGAIKPGTPRRARSSR